VAGDASETNKLLLFQIEEQRKLNAALTALLESVQSVRK